MSTAYQTYLAMQKQANLFINAERSALLSKKLLDMRVRNFQRAGGMLYKNTPHADMGGGYAAFSRPGTAPEIHHLSERMAQAQAIPGAAHRLMMHHELDELDVGARLGKHSPMSPTEVSEVHANPQALAKFEDREGTFGALLKSHQGQTVGVLPIGHHDPAVVLRESNRVAHELPPANVQDAVHLRRSTGDTGQYTLPYGKKYIAEGGREFESQRRVAMTRKKPLLMDDKLHTEFSQAGGTAYTLSGHPEDYLKRREAGRMVGKKVKQMIDEGQEPTKVLVSHYGKTIGELNAGMKQAGLPPYVGLDVVGPKPRRLPEHGALGSAALSLHSRAQRPSAEP